MLFAFTLIVMLPLGLLVITSLRPTVEIINSTFSLPVSLTLKNYFHVFSLPEVTDALLRSLTVALFVSLITVFLALPTAYFLARYVFRGKQLAEISLLIGAYVFSPSLLALPYFQFISYFGILPLHGVIVAHIVLSLPFAIALMTPIIGTFPYQTEQIAILYGWRTSRRLVKLLVPSLWPQVAGLAIIVFTVSWKEFIYAYVLNTDGSVPVMTTLLMRMYAGEAVNWDLLMPLCVLMLVPALFAAKILQTFKISHSIASV